MHSADCEDDFWLIALRYVLPFSDILPVPLRAVYICSIVVTRSTPVFVAQNLCMYDIPRYDSLYPVSASVYNNHISTHHVGCRAMKGARGYDSVIEVVGDR